MIKKSYRFINSKEKNDFLWNYLQTGSIAKAAKKTKIARQTHYDWLKNDKNGRYHEAFKKVYDMRTDYLEELAEERATVGRKEGIYYKGEKVGERTIVSDKLLMFMLQARRPDKYRQTVAEINNNNTVNVDISEAVAAARERVARANEADTEN